MLSTAGRDDHEQAGQDAEDQRDRHLDRDLLGALLGPLAALDPDLRGLHAQHLGDRDAEHVGLDHRAHEARAPAPSTGRRAPRGCGTACPCCISRSIRARLVGEGPSVFWATCWTAASDPRPASRADGDRSIASGRARRTRSDRS